MPHTAPNTSQPDIAELSADELRDLARLLEFARQNPHLSPQQFVERGVELLNQKDPTKTA